MLDAGDPSDTWERLQLLTQQLDVAVQGEDFKLAAQLRDQCKVGPNREGGCKGCVPTASSKGFVCAHSSVHPQAPAAHPQQHLHSSCHMNTH
jgi:hypothetical protein